MTDLHPRLVPPLSLLLALALSLGTAFADTARLVTFGPEADPGKGDDDFKEVVAIRVPQSIAQPLYLRIFDPDVGGAEDEPTGPWNTRTRFALIGKAPAGVPGAQPLAEGVFADDPTTDGRWHTLARFAPEQGESVAGDAVFTFTAEGLAGDDGNLYDLALSTDPKVNRPLTGVSLSARRPTLSIPPGTDRYAEVRFTVPPGTKGFSLRNFDLDSAPARLERPFAKPVTLRASEEAVWLEDGIALDPSPEPQPAGVLIRGGRTLLNNVVLEAKDGNGAALDFELPIRLVPQGRPPEPVAKLETLSDCHTVVLDASGSKAGEGRLSGFMWTFGDGQSGSGQRTTHRYAAPGTYPVLLTAIDDSGRVVDRARRAYTLKVNRSPQAVPGPKQFAAPGEPLRFDAGASTDSDGRVLGYSWDLGDGLRGDGREVSHLYARPGRYTVALRVEDDGPGPCSDATATTEVWINAPPTAEAGPDRIVAVGEPVGLDGGGSLDSDGELLAFAWDLGDGGQAQGKRIDHAYGAPGRYKVTLRVEDDARASNSQAADETTVVVNDPPLARIQGSPRGAVAETLAFDASASRDPDGALVEHRWDFGDGQVASGAQASHAFDAPGRYVVTLTVRDDSGTSSDSATAEWPVVVNHPPLADAGPDQRVTASLVRFDAGGSRDPDGRILDWHWDFGDGSVGAGATASHVYAAPGRYPVTLAVTDDSQTCSAKTIDTLTVTVNAKPVADAGPDRLAVPDEPIAFDASGSFDPDGQIADYTWDFGDGSTATGASLSHAYAGPGRYQVRLQVQDDTGHPEAAGFADALVRVNAAPVAIAGPDRRVAPGETLELDASASYDPDGQIAAYRWTFSDGEGAVEGPRASRRFREPGSVTATLAIADDSGASNGQAQDRLTVAVNHRPAAAPTAPVPGCGEWVVLDGSASSDADGDRLRYSWSFGDGSVPEEGARVLHRFPGGGRYPVVLTVDDGSGLDNATHSASTEVRIHRPPVATAEAPTLACAGEIVLFNGAKSDGPDAGSLLYTWDFGDGTQAREASPAKAYDRGGVYPVSLRVQDDSGLACNSGETRVALTVVEAPVAEAGPDRTVCAQTPVVFDGSGSRDFDGVVNAYSWDFGDGSQGGGANPTHLFAAAGDYPVTLTITGDRVGDCANRHSDRALIKVLDAPQVEIRAPEAAALGEPVRFKAVPRERTGDGPAASLSYRWDLGDGSTADGPEVAHGYPKAGRYQVVLTADAGGSGDCARVRLEHALLVNAPPLAEAGDDRVVAPGETFALDGSASADPDGAIARYEWDLGDGTRAQGARVRHVYGQPGSYAAELRVTDNTELANNEARDRIAIRANALPVPALALEPAVPCAGQDLVLDASGSRDPDGTPKDWQWSFGDGTTGQGERVLHRYAEPGRYALTLGVSDDSGVSSSAATLVRELIVNRPPLAEIDGPIRGCPGETIRFAATRSLDPDGRISSYGWAFGDGTQAEGTEVRHGYGASGRYPVTLTVTDESGSACASATRTLEARVNGAPQALIGVASRIAFLGGAHDAVLFDATGSTDPDGDPLTYRWSFGDGTGGRGPKLEHRFANAGRYSVTLEADDGSATACASGTQRIEIEVKGDDSARPATPP